MSGPQARGQENPPRPSLFEELRPDLDLAAVHHERRLGERIRRRPTSLGDAGSKLQSGRAPNHWKKPKLPAVQGGRPPLSQSLRPARPPEEGERGAGGLPGTLKGGRGARAKGMGAGFVLSELVRLCPWAFYMWLVRSNKKVALKGYTLI
jgi:hypothetical protein